MKHSKNFCTPFALFLALAGAGCAVPGQTGNRPEIAAENIFKLPREIRRFCNLAEFSYRHLKYRMIHADLNGDGNPEILLESSPAAEEGAATWTVLRKAFNGEYVAIGTVGEPLTIRRVPGSQWSELVCGGVSADGARTPVWTLSCFTRGEYREIVKLDRPAGETTPEDAFRLLSERRKKENLCFDDAERKWINLAGELYLSIEFTQAILAEAGPPPAPNAIAQKELLLRSIPKIKALDSDLLRMIHAKKVALLFMEMEAFQEADELFSVALKAQLRHAPDDAGDYADILNNRAVCAALSGDKDAAERWFTETLQYYRLAAEKDPTRRNHIASLLANLEILHNAPASPGESAR